MGPRKRSLSGDVKDSISRLYPNINEKKTPLPRYWSHDAKCEHLGLSNGQLTVTYRGQGNDKNHKDAGSVRTPCPIPIGVGIYYFEIFVVSKGRDGYMGIGISPPGQSNLNRLPGWDKDSYGYHGDDGNSFCSKGSGHPYGPTFTTGDTVGCGVNFIDRTCFFTKNGINLGAVVTDLPLKSYYPTVGLQTPGETVEANFGQKPFVFDLSDLKCEAKYFINKAISSHSVQSNNLRSIISSYLIHRGYSNTAIAFAKQTGMTISEGMQSIGNRRYLEKLILEGKISEALKETEKLYPNLLNENAKLEFLLKCRQFVELLTSKNPNELGINGGLLLAEDEVMNCSNQDGSHEVSQREVNGIADQEASNINSEGDRANSCPNTLSTSSRVGTNDHPEMQVNGNSEVVGASSEVGCTGEANNQLISSSNGAEQSSTAVAEDATADNHQQQSCSTANDLNDGAATSNNDTLTRLLGSRITDSDESSEMDCDSSNSCHAISSSSNNNHTESQNKFHSTDSANQNHATIGSGTEAVDGNPQQCSDIVVPNDIISVQSANSAEDMRIMNAVALGRKLRQLADKVIATSNESTTHKENIEQHLLEVFGLLAYDKVEDSPLKHVLEPIHTESLCNLLNGAILQSHNMSAQSPLHTLITHSATCIQEMTSLGIPEAAFVNVNELLNSK